VEKKIDYRELYKIQDGFLDIVFALNNTFYLTGGTALHRFYYNYRYSDDLDLFTSADPLFGEYLKEITGRDEEKDIFDLFSIAFNEKFRWPDIMMIVNKKSQTDVNTLAQRIISFPLSWLKKIKSTENELIISKKDILVLCEDILNERENSLVRNK
jgi:hypothetical protein